MKKKKKKVIASASAIASARATEASYNSQEIWKVKIYKNQMCFDYWKKCCDDEWKIHCQVRGQQFES